MNALATIRQAPGLDRYLDLLEHRLEDAVGAFPGRLGEVGADTLAAGGKRLRPLLVFLSTPVQERDGERSVAGGAAVELVHMATLVHDDLLDGADLRRGRPTVWSEHGEAIARSPVPQHASSTASPGRTTVSAASRRQRRSSPAVIAWFMKS